MKEELILQDAEQQRIAAMLGIPVCYVFDGSVNESVIRDLYRWAGLLPLEEL